VWGGWPVTIRDLPPLHGDVLVCMVDWLRSWRGDLHVCSGLCCGPTFCTVTLMGPEPPGICNIINNDHTTPISAQPPTCVVGFYSRVTHLTGSVFDLARRKAPEHTTSWLATGGEGLSRSGQDLDRTGPRSNRLPWGHGRSQAHGIVSPAPTVATAGASKHRLSIRHGGLVRRDSENLEG
jgi:hypothetical protein